MAAEPEAAPARSLTHAHTHAHVSFKLPEQSEPQHAAEPARASLDGRRPPARAAAAAAPEPPHARPSHHGSPDSGHRAGSPTVTAGPRVFSRSATMPSSRPSSQPSSQPSSRPSSRPSSPGRGHVGGGVTPSSASPSGRSHGADASTSARSPNTSGPLAAGREPGPGRRSHDAPPGPAAGLSLAGCVPGLPGQSMRPFAKADVERLWVVFASLCDAQGFTAAADLRQYLAAGGLDRKGGGAGGGAFGGGWPESREPPADPIALLAPRRSLRHLGAPPEQEAAAAHRDAAADHDARHHAAGGAGGGADEAAAAAGGPGGGGHGPLVAPPLEFSDWLRAFFPASHRGERQAMLAWLRALLAARAAAALADPPPPRRPRDDLSEEQLSDAQAMFANYNTSASGRLTREELRVGMADAGLDAAEADDAFRGAAEAGRAFLLLEDFEDLMAAALQSSYARVGLGSGAAAAAALALARGGPGSAGPNSGAPSRGASLDLVR